MLNKFNKLCDMILESSDEINSSNSQESLENNDVNPSCCYCGSPVSIDIYERQKEWHDTQMDGFFRKNNIPFDPKQCVCEKCSAALSKMYSGGSKWTGD